MTASKNPPPTSTDSAGSGVPLFLYRRRERRLLREFVRERERELEAKAARLADLARRKEKKGKGGAKAGSSSSSSTGPATSSSRAHLSAALFGAHSRLSWIEPALPTCFRLLTRSAQYEYVRMES